jgi:DNA-binding GntR family transcriptional regulator
MVIEHGAPEPLYLQLAAIIRARIASGEYPPRTRVPSVTALAAEHGVAEMTARKALRLLRDAGLLVIVDGRGSFTAGPQAPQK